MLNILRFILSSIFTFWSLRYVNHGEGCKCNFPCYFTRTTKMGNNCHFNGIKVSGKGKLEIGDNFHSGKKIRILTTFHNYDKGKALPYDNTTYSRNIEIGNNVWIGESVLILGGIKIGEGAVVQAGSVVCKDIPPLSIVGGHPAVAFKYRDKEHYYNLLKNQN